MHLIQGKTFHRLISSSEIILIAPPSITAKCNFYSSRTNALRGLTFHSHNYAAVVKAERDAQVREVYDRAAKMEAEVKLIDESKADLAETLGELKKLRSEKRELNEKLNKVRDEVAEVSDEWKQFPAMKSEIETMQKEIERRRAVIEHEGRVYDSNIKQSQLMENYKMLMAGEIMKLQVEVSDAAKRARAAAAAEATSVPGTLEE